MLISHLKTLRTLLGVSLVLSGCADAEKNDEGTSAPKDNLTCEAECVSERLAEISDCFEDETACIADCSGPSDSTCVEACGDDALPCTRSLYFCVADCACFQEWGACSEDCTELDCLTGCSDGYDVCAGLDSPFNCRLDCDNVRFDCTQSCEAAATTAAELASCMNPCDVAYRACHATCTN